MKIYTSYFARAKALKQKGVVVISTSLYPPRFMPNLDEIKALAPDRKTLNLGKAGDTKGYYESFMEMLNKTDPEEILEQIREISEENNGADVALCCYEKVTDFCHRHIVADWLNKALGDKITPVEEFGEGRKYGGIMMIQKSFWV